MDLSTVYSRLLDFADQFANSSAGSGMPVLNRNNPEEKAIAEETAIDYAVKEENYFGDLLDNKIVRSCLKSIADKYYGNQITEIKHEGVQMTKDSYPLLYATYANCCHILEIKNPPIVYITNKLRGINALSVEINNERMILISRRVAISLTTKEQAFVLGHELGHHQQGNLIGHTVNGLVNSLSDKSEIFGPMVQDAIEVPLKRWCRRSEFNADRAGFLCCKDMEAIKQLFMKIGMIESVTVYHQYKETGEDHPMLVTRLQELNRYATLIQCHI